MLLLLFVCVTAVSGRLSVPEVRFSTHLDKQTLLSGLQGREHTFRKRICLTEEASKCVDCIFFRCHSQKAWGGALYSGVPLFLSNCLFHLCTSESGAGAFSSGSFVTVTMCTFKECSAHEFGVFVSQGDGHSKGSIERSHLVLGSANYTGSYIISNQIAMDMTFVNLSHSSAQNGGAFGDVLETSSVFGYCKFSNGTVDTNTPCIRFIGGASVDLKSCVFQGFRSLGECTANLMINVIELHNNRVTVLDSCHFLKNGQICANESRQVEFSGKALIRNCHFDKPMSDCFEDMTEVIVDETIFNSLETADLQFRHHIGFASLELRRSSLEILQINRFNTLLLSLVAFAVGWAAVKLQARNRPLNKQGNFQRLD